MSKPSVELTIRYGFYGEKSQTVALPISESLMRELMGQCELSDEPISLLLSSPAVWGGKGDAVSVRRKTFQMRRDIANEIAKAMVPALLKAFGVNDVLDGYSIEKMSPEEREWHRKRGRLPSDTD